MSYYCPKCGKTFDKVDVAGGLVLRCPYCSSRILFKTRPPVVKVVKAR